MPVLKVNMLANNTATDVAVRIFGRKYITLNAPLPRIFRRTEVNIAANKNAKTICGMKFMIHIKKVL